MISLCQDISISYEYHIYENKTVKKIQHKRNGSAVSQKTFVKSSKLSLVSKDIKDNETFKMKSIVSQNNISKKEKIQNNLKLTNNRHKRCWSNNVNCDANRVFQTKNEAANILRENPEQLKKYRAPVFQHKIEPKRTQVYFNSTIEKNLPLNQNCSNIIFPNKDINFAQGPNFNTVIHPGNLTASRYFRNQKEKILRIQSFNKRLFKNHHQDIFQKNNLMTTRANSLVTHQTVLKQNLQKIDSSTVQDFTCMEKQFVEKSNQNYFPQRKTSQYLNFSNQVFLSPSQTQNNQIRQKFSFVGFDKGSQEQNEEKKKDKFSTFFKDSFLRQKENIFDVKSIVSFNLNDENSSEVDSVVQQRNFFFQKEQQPAYFTNKALQNFQFLEPGIASQKQYWILFRNVKEKNTNKIYSVKQFPIEKEKLCLNQYEIYLTLKAEHNNIVSCPQQNTYYLNCYNMIQSKQQQKLYLLKQNFQYGFMEYINYLKKQSQRHLYPQKFLQIEFSILNNQIKAILQNLSYKNFGLQKYQEFEIQDFVVTKSQSHQMTVKFHNFCKLAKIETDKLNFQKFNKVKYHFESNKQEQISDQKQLILNQDLILRKVFNTLFLS